MYLMLKLVSMSGGAMRASSRAAMEEKRVLKVSQAAGPL